VNTPFDIAFKFTVGEEGKLSLDPKDPGNWTSGVPGVGQLKGTKYGVSARAYPNIDIANLTITAAKMIAETKYWKPTQCDALPPPLALQVFDTAYNMGVEEATRVLQQTLGVPVDLVIGPKTLAAANKAKPKEVAELFAEFRIEAYKRDDRFSTYGDGWINRANAARAAAEEMIA
jgi:lysozyme family protein